MTKREFKSLEMQVTVRELFKIWSKRVKCRNIHWITFDTLNKLAVVDAQVWKWTLDAEQNVASHRPAMLDQVFHFWKNVSRLPLMEEIHRPLKFADGKNQNALAPVYGPSFGQLMGFFLFEGLKGKDKAKQLRDIHNLIRAASLHLEFCWQYSQARAQSFMDDLTSLYNQRYLPVVFEREIARMERLKKKFSVLFMDIDYFKRVNDTRGHWIGSRLLVEVAEVIKQATRSCDYAFRYGGDEFLIVLVDTAPEIGQKVAERIRSRIEKHEFRVENQPIQLTVSIGLAAYPDHAKSTMELIQLADQAMYYGKNKSRNIVFLAG